MALSRRCRRGLQLALALAALGGGCSTFSASGIPPGTASSEAGSDAPFAGDSSVNGVLEFVNSRTTTSPSNSPLDVRSPAGVKPGDLLVAGWVSPNNDPPTPEGWDPIGGAPVLAYYGNIQRGFSVLSHLVAAAEGETTVYHFADAADVSSVAVLAFRGARSVQPVDPSKVAPGQFDGGTVRVDALTTRGPTLPVWLLGCGAEGSTFSPSTPDLTLDEAGRFVAGYHGKLVAGGVTIPAFDLALTTQFGVGVASLALVAPE